jgi:dienelactone hydrolase
MRQPPCVLAVVLIGCLCLSRASAQEPKPVVHSTATFPSADKKVRIERFQPAGKGSYPAIVLVPESKSLDEVGDVFRAIAGRVAEEGYVVLMVHFFDRTGHKGVDPRKIEEKDFKAWMGAVRDATVYARTLKNVEPKRVGLLGFSLGGFLCLAVAAERDVGVDAVASYFGGVPDKLWPKLTWLPPTLVVGGAKDTVVPVTNAYTLVGFCHTHGLDCEHRIYTKQDHLFGKELKGWVLADYLRHLAKGKKFSAAKSIGRAIRSNKTLREAVGVGTSFFEKHLKATCR